MSSTHFKFLALSDTLEGLTKSDLRRFFQILRRKDPRVNLSSGGFYVFPDGNVACGLMQLTPGSITGVLVSTYREDVALFVAVEVLKEMECHDEAERLSVMEAHGKYFISDPRGKEIFVDKYKYHLIYNVKDVRPILDELLAKELIQQESYDRIRALPTSVEKMRELLDCLRAVGVEGKVILYDVIEKLEPHLLEEIMMPVVLQSASAGSSSMTDYPSIHTTEMKKIMLTTRPWNGWIKLDPEVNSVDTLTYSQQSEAGNFECSVSRLRWVCKEKVSFKYQFGFWEEHMERLKPLQFIPGGPLLDITVIEGKLDEVYLPHWIRTRDIPKILRKFAVLHVDTCGDEVEQVAEVTRSHVKLSQTVFSPRGVLIRVGFPLKIYCQVLIYKTNKSFLTLHVYLVPRDPALQQTIKNKESSHGHKMIQKPYPQKSLKMRDRFVLTSDKDGAEIYPEKLKLVYESSDPNFFEVYIEKPDSDFRLILSNESVPVWTCAIRKDDYQKTGGIQVKYEEELARVRTELVASVSRELINQLLDDLLEDKVLSDEEMDSILRENTRADRARCLIDTVKRKGRKASRMIFTHLHSRDPTLYAELGLPPCRPV